MNRSEILKEIEHNRELKRVKERELLLKNAKTERCEPKKEEVIKLLVNVKNKNRVMKILQDKGYTTIESESAINEHITDAEKKIETNAWLIFVSGIGLLSLGIYLTNLSVHQVNADSFYVFYGAILTGIIQIFRGLLAKRKIEYQ